MNDRNDPVMALTISGIARVFAGEVVIGGVARPDPGSRPYPLVGQCIEYTPPTGTRRTSGMIVGVTPIDLDGPWKLDVVHVWQRGEVNEVCMATSVEWERE